MQARIQNQADLIVGSITTLLAFAVYWTTMARDITWANYGVDGGDLITAVITHGNPHPSGYPVYLFLGYLIEKLPLSPIAWRFNVFSAFTMACAIGFVTVTALYFIETETQSSKSINYLIAAAVGLTVAFASLIWGQAVITEVYSLFILLGAAFLWALLTRKPAWLTGLLLGLTISAHLSGLLLLPLAIILTAKKQLGWFFGGFFVGLLPFALLPLLSKPESPVVWGDLDTIQGWWWLISGQLYRGYAFSLPPGDWLARASAWSQIIFSQFTWAGIPLIFFAFFLADFAQRRLFVLLMGTAVLYFVLAFFYNTDDAIIFTLPSWLLLSLLLIPALQKLGWLALILPLVLLLINFQANNLKNNHIIRTHTEQLLTEIPVTAVVETPGDPTIFTLWYFIHAEDQRADIIPVDSNLFAFDWYRSRLQHLYPTLQGLEQDNLALFRERNKIHQPYCFASLAQEDLAKQTPYLLTCLDNGNS